MPATDPTSLVASATCIECGIPPGAQLPVMISLLAQIANVSTDPNTLMANAACMTCIPPGAQWPVVIYLLTQIATSGGGIIAANYSGGTPSFTPTTPGAVAVDTSNGRIWWWYNNQWN